MKPVASTDFKQAMRYLAGAVTIVTTGSGEERRGLTATAVCSLSADPPRVIACINRNGITYEMISKSRKLGINILSAAHQTLAMRFAGMMDIGDVDRFGEGKWRTLSTGAPILDDALTAMERGELAQARARVDALLAIRPSSRPLLDLDRRLAIRERSAAPPPPTRRDD